MSAPDPTWLILAQGGGLSAGGLQGWIHENVVPLVLLGIAVILLWIGGWGQVDKAGVVLHLMISGTSP